jgi:alkanesulfonate monooxygenase SsuD/methylene tetrahydromethanopterin reductase-like flavin-dependent oxidoreductase (luciferase family)
VSSIRLGVALWSQVADWDDYQAAAQLVDSLGYDILLTNDHLLSEVGPPDQVKYEAWTALAAWATVTQHAQLGHWVGCNTFRDPALVAKMATTVDHASHGRCILALGSGWFQLEHEVCGIEFGGSPGQRLNWLDESISILRRLFNGETVTHDGPHYQIHGLKLYPPPVNGKLPIMIGGSGEQKTLRTIARYADMWDIGGEPTVERIRHKLDVLDERCAEVGRDVSEIERIVSTRVYVRDNPDDASAAYASAIRNNGKEPSPNVDPWAGPPEVVAERMRPYIEMGVTSFIADFPAPYDRESIERWIGEVKPLLEG